MKTAKKQNVFVKPALILLSFAVLILIWQLAAVIIDVPLILPRPKQVFIAFFQLLGRSAFWTSLGTSFIHIYSGCLAGLLVGVIIGIITCIFPPFDTMLSPIFSIVRSTPVACFIIVAWTLIGAENLPFFISLLMVAPVMMTGTQSGIRATSKDLLEASRIYQLSFAKTIRTCYLPAIVPHLFTTVINCLGLAWKAGIAAEVIVRVKGTVGYAIWEAKSWDINSSNLFAWTIAVIIISLVLEYLFKWLSKKLLREVSV